MDVILQRDGTLRAECSECGKTEQFMLMDTAWTWVLEHECATGALPTQRRSADDDVTAIGE